jgi:hypothetical protein
MKFGMKSSPQDKARLSQTPIDDFGQQIDGARKDGRKTLHEALRADLPGNPDEISLSEHLPRPDARALLESGMEPRRVAAVCALRDCMPKKPAGEAKLAEWSRTLGVVRSLIARLLDHKSPLAMEEFDRAIASIPKLREAVEHYHSLGYPAFLKARLGATRFRIFRDTTNGEFFIGWRSQQGVIRLQSGFQSAAAASDWLAANKEEVVIRWKRLRQEMRADNCESRIGPQRREGDVTPAQFTEAFGFRGVQFGNSVPLARRQTDLNNAFDAFMDLAEALSIPPKAVSLDGSLALAFGARGSGGRNAAAAHYETDSVVINLTQKNGPGSLAHEWFHALDNYFARLERTGRTAPKPEDDYTSDLEEPPANIRPEVLAAFQRIHRSLDHDSYAARCAALDADRETSYHSLAIEKSARAFEMFLIERMAMGGIENPFLAKPRSELLDAYPRREEMDAGLRETYDALFDTLQTKETENGVALFTKPRRRRAR